MDSWSVAPRQLCVEGWRVVAERPYMEGGRVVRAGAALRAGLVPRQGQVEGQCGRTGPVGASWRSGTAVWRVVHTLTAVRGGLGGLRRPDGPSWPIGRTRRARGACGRSYNIRDRRSRGRSSVAMPH